MPSLALACRLSAVSMALRQAYPGAFDPASLFANGEQGLWYDIGDFDRYMSELGPNSVVNGGFDNGLTGWTAKADVIVDSGRAKCFATNASYNAVLRQTQPFNGAGWYRIHGNIQNVSMQTWCQLQARYVSNESFIAASHPNAHPIGAVLSADFSFYADAPFYINFLIDINVNDPSRIAYVDNIRCEKLTALNTATLFQDAAGTIPVFAVEQPVGLILDKSKGLVLGPNIAPGGGTFDSAAGWSLGAAQITGGQLVFGGINQTVTYDIGMVPGRWYEIQFDLTARTAGLVRGLGGPFVEIVGRHKYVFMATGSIGGFNAANNFNGSIDNWSVRELPGNHASQATTTARGVLRARYNQLTFADDFSNAAWAKTTGINVTGTKKLVPTTASGIHKIQNSQASGLTNVTGKFTMRCRAKADGYNIIAFWFDTASVGARFNVATGTVVSSAGVVAGTTPTITPDADGYYDCVVTVQVTNGTHAVYVLDNSNNVSFAGDGTSGVLVDWIDVRPANLPSGLPPYQRIAAATDYDTVGFPVYLDIDGTDDNYVTGSIDFTATDKMTVWAGMRKLDDTGRILCELSANVHNNAGSFYFVTGLDGAPSSLYSTHARGSVSASWAQVGRFTTGLYPAPDSAVITATHDIAGDISTIRRNGSSDGAIDGTADKGTGNFGNYPLYLFSRGGTLVRWRGHFYGLIVRGAATETTQLEQTEQWLNQRMGGIY